MLASCSTGRSANSKQKKKPVARNMEAPVRRGRKRKRSEKFLTNSRPTYDREKKTRASQGTSRNYANKKTQSLDNFPLILIDCEDTDRDDIPIDSITDKVHAKKLQEKLLDRREEITLAKEASTRCSR